MKQTRRSGSHHHREENTPIATVYDLITDKILEKLQHGIVPWQKPWNSAAGFSRSLMSQKPYRGINVWVLGSAGYSSPFGSTNYSKEELVAEIRAATIPLPH